MSPVTLQFDHPDFPDETEFGIGTIGRVKNHGTLEVDDDAAAKFEATNGMSLQEYFSENPMYTIDGVQGKAKEKPDNETTNTQTETTTQTDTTELPEFSPAPSPPAQPQQDEGGVQ